jgi:uncharacterized protein YjbI with pentapeptide repeats
MCDNKREFVDRIKIDEIEEKILSGDQIILNEKIIDGNFNINKISAMVVGDKAIVTSPISISNSKFCGSLNFQNAIFKSKISFNGVTFLDSLDFSNSEFIEDVYFGSSIFQDNVYFSEAKFKRFAHFWGSKFYKEVNFIEAIFFEGADFRSTKFSQDLNFAKASFKGYAEFAGSIFRKYVNFSNAEFVKYANFEKSRFLHNIDFVETNFLEKLNFIETSFERDVVFLDSVFKDKISFKKTNLKYIDIQWSSIRNYTEYDTKTILALIENYKYKDNYKDANNCYYDFRMQKLRNRKLSSKKILDYLACFIWGFGVKPERILLISSLLVFSFAFIFWESSSLLTGRPPLYNNTDSSFVDAFSYSLNIFVAKIPTDLKTKDIYLYIAILEGLLGWLFLGVMLNATLRSKK